MKIKHYLFTLLIMLMLCAGLALPLTAQAEEETEEYAVDVFPYTTVDYDYKCIDGELRTFYTVYNDGMLLVDSYEASPDLAKLSVSLAIAAYRSDEIITMLRDMRYKPLGVDPDDPDAEWAGEDFLYNYDRSSSYEDNDFVGYAIGRKRIEYKGTVYYAYLVAVRGTPTSAEWYSNFNIGNRSDGYHQGFKLAADEIIATLQNSIDTENNIILFTGHSRGAAVANILGGEYNRGNILDHTQAKQMFCYTFACPAVIKDAPESTLYMPNIFNYNNAGDAITVVPPSIDGWGFRRYGTDIQLSMDQENLSYFLQRFLSEHGEEYKGLRTTDSFTEALKLIAATYEASQKKTNRFLFDVVAWGLGDKSLETIPKIIDKYGLPNKKKVKKVLVQFATEAIKGLWTAATDSEYIDIRMLYSEIDTFIADMSEVTDEEAFMTAYQNDRISQRILEETEYDPQTMAEVFSVRDDLEEQVRTVSFLDAGVEGLFQFLFTAGQHNVKTEISHAHTGETYVQWINSMFYGYEGWKGNADITAVTVPNRYTIGPSCFYGCSSLTEIVINSSSGYVDSGAFAGCKGDDITLTMPIDFERIEPTAFGASNGQMTSQHNTSKITTLHYTAGATGIQRDRRPYSEDPEQGVYYMNVPEYYLRSVVKNIEFGEGVKHIGNYAWETSSRDSMYGTYVAACDIKSVTWPGSLEEIGDYAFFGRNIKNDSFFSTVKRIGDLAFYDSQFEGSCVIGSQVEYIGDRAFNEACYEELTVLNPDTEMHAIFGSPIHKVTIPVDMENAAEKLGVVYTAGNANSVRELHYTAGKTGVMPARTAFHDGSGSNKFFYCLEAKAQGVKKIVFEEGVTEICQSSLVRADIQLPKSLVKINVDLSGSHEYVAYGAYLYSIDVPCCKTVYGYRDTVAGSYAAQNNMAFVPLHVPMFKESEEDAGVTSIVVERGNTVTVPVLVYTGIGETTDQVNWTVEDNMSADSVMDSEGCFTLGLDEPVWNYLHLKAEYDGYSSWLGVYVDRRVSWNTITLDPMGGTLPEGSEVVHVESGTCLKDANLPVPVMEGYTFDHWYYLYDNEGAFMEQELYDDDTLDYVYELYAAWYEGDPPEPQYTDIALYAITLDQDYFLYSGEENRPKATVKNGIDKLIEGLQYELVYTDNINAGTATVTANGIGYFYGSISTTFEIAKQLIESQHVEAIPDQYYTGQPVCPVPVVTLHGVVLVPGRDFTLEYNNNVEVGRASVKITGTGNYNGGANRVFNIIKNEHTFSGDLTWELQETAAGTGAYKLVISGTGAMDMNNEEAPWTEWKDAITAAEVSEGVTTIGWQAFSGMSALETVSLPSTLTLIEEGAFCACTSLEELEIPDGTAVCSGVFEGCTALRQVLFGRDCSGGGDSPALPFDSSAHPGLTVVGFKGTWAEETVEYYNSNVEGSSFRFTAVLNAEDYTVTIPGQTYTGSALKPAPEVRFGDEVLTKGTDYTVTYKNNTNAGTATVTIKGIGNYTGTLTAEFTIAKAAQPSWKATAAAASVAVGKTSAITATGLKESPKLTYSSADKTIAAVSSSGVITAKSVGTVKITVKAAATSNYKASSRTLTIKVVPGATASVTLTNTASGVKVAWKKVEGATGYYVYRNGDKVKEITKGSTVTYTDKNAKTNGTKYTYKVVAFAGTGSSTLSKSRTTYYVSRPVISALTSTMAKKLTVTWGKNAKAGGYQIEYSKKSSFADSKTVTVSSGSTVKKVLGSLTSKTTYYVRVRAYKTVSGTKYYSAWSAAKSIKVK